MPGTCVELDARAEAAVLVAEFDDVERGAFGDAGDVAQQGPGGGVEIDADAVDAAFDDGLERFAGAGADRHRADTGRRRWIWDRF